MSSAPEGLRTGFVLTIPWGGYTSLRLNGYPETRWVGGSTALPCFEWGRRRLKGPDPPPRTRPRPALASAGAAPKAGAAAPHRRLLAGAAPPAGPTGLAAPAALLVLGLAAAGAVVAAHCRAPPPDLRGRWPGPWRPNAGMV